MTLRLQVDRAAWLAHVERTAGDHPGLIPVVKGNGYGFGIPLLCAHALGLSGDLAVGSVFEARHVPSTHDAHVLTPLGPGIPADDVPGNAVLTVGSTWHVQVLAEAGWRGRVSLKLRSSMQRYGTVPREVGALRDAATAAGLEPVAWSLHLPLDGTEESRLGEARAWIGRVDADLPLHVSHLSAESAAALRREHPRHAVRVRLGTGLWLGDKSMLHLAADVLDVHPGASGRAGYRLAEVPDGAAIVLAGAGTSHGAFPLDDGRSPFHFARRRLPLIEPPHMHTSMLVVADGGPCPEPGDALDLQVALTRAHPDVVEWS
jgi:alanine racemase